MRRTALALLLAVAACGGGNGTPGEAGGTGSGDPVATNTFSEPRPTDAPSPGETASESPPVATDAPSPAETTAAPTAPGATYDLSAQGPIDCSYVPNGGSDGRDALNVGFHLVLIGSSGLDRMVDVVGRSDTGLSARVSAQANNRGQTLLTFTPRPEDFGRTHRIEITVDPANQFRETDESNNAISLSVTLPAPRPTRPIDPLTCG